MRLLVSGDEFDNPPLLNSGGEGEIFSLDAQSVAKVYYEHLRSDERKQKVLALCDSYSNFSARYSNSLIAFPEAPAYEFAVSFDTLVGFSMSRLAFPTIATLSFNIKTGAFDEASGLRFDDGRAIAFVYDLFALVEQLHQSRIVLGDINPANIMCEPSTSKPVIVDIDAAQIGGFPCETTHPDYNDPRLGQRGRRLGGAFNFDFGTDIFALSVVCFEFLIGVRPHQLHVTPPKRATENKALGITNLGWLELGPKYLATLGVSYLDCPENTTIQARLSRLKSLDRRLYDFFADVFVRDQRDNVLFSLPLTDGRHPGHHFFVESGFKRVVDEEAKKRIRAAAEARQGVGVGRTHVPDSGFRKLIGSLISSKPAVATAVKKTPKTRTDPDALNAFLQRFGLKIGT
jgi:serine/threonine protein kinase